MKTAIIYKSKAGYVKQYAEWLAEELSADLYKGKISKSKMKQYDTIIFGGGIYASNINGIKFVKKNIDALKEKNFLLFATGAAPYTQELLKEIKAKNLTTAELNGMKMFYLRGGFSVEKMTFIDRLVMNRSKNSILKKKKKGKTITSEEKNMLASFDRNVDFTKKRNLQEILVHARMGKPSAK